MRPRDEKDGALVSKAFKVALKDGLGDEAHHIGEPAWKALDQERVKALVGEEM